MTLKVSLLINGKVTKKAKVAYKLLEIALDDMH